MIIINIIATVATITTVTTIIAIIVSLDLPFTSTLLYTSVLHRYS